MMIKMLQGNVSPATGIAPEPIMSNPEPCRTRNAAIASNQ